ATTRSAPTGSATPSRLPVSRAAGSAASTRAAMPAISPTSSARSSGILAAAADPAPGAGAAIAVAAIPRPCRVVAAAAAASGLAGGRGDLYLAVTVAPHPLFERKGDDIQLELPITAPEAALGANVEVPTLRGKVSMKILPATSSGRTFRLPGYGMPRVRTS